MMGDEGYLNAAIIAAERFIDYQFGSAYAVKERVMRWYEDEASLIDDSDWNEIEGAFIRYRLLPQFCT